MKRADQRKFHYLYKITRFDGKYYFGIHSTDDLEDGYFGSGTYLWKSLNRHGKEKHSKEILEFFETRQASKDKEKQIITDEMRADNKCMNIAPGGGGGFADEKHQQKCATAGGLANGSKVSWERHRDKLSKVVSNELKRRHSLGLVKYNNTLGMKFSDETKCKMSIAGSGINNSQFGTCWVTNGIKPIKIKKEFLDEYLGKGYSKGRK